LAPVNTQESHRDMFEGLFDPPLRTPPSFSRPEASSPSTIVLEPVPRPAEAGSSAPQNEAPSAEPSQAASTATTQTQETSISGRPAPRRRPHGAKEGSIQKRQGTQPSQTRLNRRLGAKLTRGRPEVRRHSQASTWAATDRRDTREARRIAPASIEPTPRGEPQLPLGLMPRHARRE
jgi:hypothetical protein